MFLKQEQVDRKEEELRKKLTYLPDDQRLKLYSNFSKTCKDPDTYAALNWSLFVGFHHLYLKQYFRAFADWLSVFIGVYLLMQDITIGALFIIVVTLFELYQLFRSQIIVQNHNNQLTEELLHNNKCM